MCNTKKLMAWQAECLRSLLQSGVAELELVITPDAVAMSAMRRCARLTPDRGGLAFTIYELLTFKAWHASRLIDMTKQLKDVEHLSCRPILKAKCSQHFSTEDVARVRSHDLDFILKFGFGVIHGEILKSARYGVWSFHHNDETQHCGWPIAFWEIYHGDPLSGAMLERLTDNLDCRIILHQGLFPTVGYSWNLNRDQVLLGATKWPQIVCQDILNGCANYIVNEVPTINAPIHIRPTNWQTVRAFVKMGKSFVKHLQKLIVQEQWQVGIVRAPIHTFIDRGPKTPVEWLPDLPRTRFFADPFAIKRGAEIIILLEDFDHLRRKGRISFIRSTDGGRGFSSPVPITGSIFDQSTHKSYPYLFEHQGEIYCVPATEENNEIALYRALQFPEHWERVCVLMDGIPAVDPTVFHHGGYWWMFYSMARDLEWNVNLYLSSAPELEGPWSAHPANPVKTDISSARPGGTPFVHDGILYRPAQDSTHTYGGGLVIHRVDKLTQTQYKEHVVCRLTHDHRTRYCRGFHTLAAAGDLCVVDGKRFVALPQVLPRMLRDKIRSAIRRRLVPRRQVG